MIIISTKCLAMTSRLAGGGELKLGYGAANVLPSRRALRGRVS